MHVWNMHVWNMHDKTAHVNTLLHSMDNAGQGKINHFCTLVRDIYWAKVKILQYKIFPVYLDK